MTRADIEAWKLHYESLAKAQRKMAAAWEAQAEADATVPGRKDDLRQSIIFSSVQSAERCREYAEWAEAKLGEFMVLRAG